MIPFICTISVLRYVRKCKYIFLCISLTNCCAPSPEKIAKIWHMVFSNAFSHKRNVVLWNEFHWILFQKAYLTGDPLHSRAACTQPCNVNTHSRAHCSPGARLCEQWGHGCVNNWARLCASARLCRGSPVYLTLNQKLAYSCQHHDRWHPGPKVTRSSAAIVFIM